MSFQYGPCATAMLMRVAALALLVPVGMQGQTLTREYIHRGGRVIAVENASATVTPSSVRLGPGQSQAFTTNITPAVWTLNPTTGAGTITGSGTYTAPGAVSTEMTVTVEVRQSVGGGVVKSATVVLEPTTLVVTPASAQAQPSGSISFSANMAATWSLSPATGAGTINAATGQYQAPATISSSQSVTVTATSTGNPAKSGVSALTLFPTGGGCVPTPTSLLFGPAPVGQSLSMTSCPTGYQWTTSNSGATWVTINPASGTGGATISATPTENTGTSTRTGTIVINGTSVTVQQAPPCNNTFSNRVVGSPSQSVTGQVSCGAGVPWVSTTNGATWLRLNPASGTGSLSTTLSIDPYTGTGTRTATVKVAGKSFTVTQHAPCTVSPLTVSLGGGLDSKNVALTCSTAAPWAARRRIRPGCASMESLRQSPGLAARRWQCRARRTTLVPAGQRL